MFFWKKGIGVNLGHEWVDQKMNVAPVDFPPTLDRTV